MTLQKLRQLDLTTYPYEEIRDLFQRLGKVGTVIVTLHPGRTFVRVRSNSGNEVFTKKSELSYKPQHLNKTYQRASTPNKTMLYGSMLHETDNSNDINARIVGALEGLPWLRDNTSKGVQKATFSVWEVKQDIDLVGIVHQKDFHDKNPHLKELVEAFTSFMSQHPNYFKPTMMVSDFLAQEYAKLPIENDYEYMFSAIYSELVINHGLHGVYYPSVRTDGRGLNVAIKPDIADQNMVLKVAGEVMVYKYQDRIIADNISVAEVPFGQDTFDLKPVEAKYHFGEENCLKHLGVRTIGDLENK